MEPFTQKKGKAIHKLKNPTKLTTHGWEYEIELRDVNVMVVSGNYAMVRRPNCLPYVASLKEVFKVED